MRRRCLAAAVAAVVLGVAAPGAGAAQTGDGLEVYSATVGATQLGELSQQGVDLSVEGRVGVGNDRRVECGVGHSNGWQQWAIDLSAYEGESVEISIAYASDWAVQNLGVFVDDVTLPDGTSTSFESGLEGWAVTGPPEGSGPNANNWVVTDPAGFPVGASITTPSSILMGYGFEGISTREQRKVVMGRALDHLLGSGR